MIPKKIFPQNIYLNLALIFSISSVILVGLFSSNIPSIVSWGQKYEDLHFNLSVSFISSYIFYFIVVHLKERKDFQYTLPYISGLTNKVLSEHKSLMISLDQRLTGNKNYNTAITPQLREEDLYKILSNLALADEAPLLLATENRNTNWREYIIFRCEETRASIEKIISLTLFLQSEYAHIILKLESCSLLKTSDNLKSPAFVQMVNNSGMNFLLNDFYKYHIICLELEDYKNKHMTVFA